jgi:hypothetical protein
MFDRADLDSRFAAHATRVARVDGEGWRRPIRASTRRSHGPVVAVLVVGAGYLRRSTRLVGRIHAAPAGRGIG